MKDITIITVCYNSEKTIERTIRSVLSQKAMDVEYIIIDGGSTDGTCKLITKYLDEIDFFISEKDDGISDAFNKGIIHAKGRYIGLLNSDDELKLGALRKILDVISVIDDDIICFSMDIIDGVNKITVKSDSQRLNEGMYVAHPGTFVKKTVYSQIGSFDPQYKYSMDYEFLLRAKHNGFSFYDYEFSVVNMYAGGVSDIHPYKAVLECARAFSKYNKSRFLTVLFSLNYLLKRFFVRNFY